MFMGSGHEIATGHTCHLLMPGKPFNVFVRTVSWSSLFLSKIRRVFFLCYIKPRSFSLTVKTSQVLRPLSPPQCISENAQSKGGRFTEGPRGPREAWGM